MTQIPPQVPPPSTGQPEQPVEETVGNTESLSLDGAHETVGRNRAKTTRNLYVLALLTGFIYTLTGLLEYRPSGPLTYLFPVTVLVGTVYTVMRSFRPGAEPITLGRALIAAGLVPTGVMLAAYAYFLIPDWITADSDGNNWGGLAAVMLLIYTVPVIVPPVGVGLLVRQKERKAESLPVYLGVLAAGAFVWFVFCLLYAFGA